MPYIPQEVVPDDIELIDDGTLDTVVRVWDAMAQDCQELRFSQEVAADYRTPDGHFTGDTWLKFCEEIVIPLVS